MKDFMSKHEEEIRGSTLNYSTNPAQAFDEWDNVLMQEEAYYVHTINDFVELIVVYGYEKVIGDLRTAMAEKTW